MRVMKMRWKRREKSDVRGGGYEEERGQEEKGWRNPWMDELETREKWTCSKIGRRMECKVLSMVM